MSEYLPENGAVTHYSLDNQVQRQLIKFYSYQGFDQFLSAHENDLSDY